MSAGPGPRAAGTSQVRSTAAPSTSAPTPPRAAPADASLDPPSPETAETRSAPPGPNWDLLELISAIVLVFAAVAILEAAYSQSPLPPGVDPGDWLQRSYAFVGLPHPPVQAVGSPYLYPPLAFPILGALVVLTGSPLTAGFVFGGLLLTLYGLSCIVLGWAYLRPGAPRLLFVGLAVLNGTTLSMLFWGGYPNVFAFLFLNLAFVGLLRFLRAPTFWNGVWMYGMAGLLYLTHTLTFAMLIVGALGAIVLVATSRPAVVRTFFSLRALLATLALLIPAGTYELLSRIYHISHPGYLYANPAALVLDNLGEMFQPLGGAPMFFPAGAPFVTSPDVVLAMLLASAAAIVVAVLYLDRRVRGWLNDPLRIGLGWLAATLAVPALGDLAHIGTDYTRFVYFLPLPISLVVALFVERMLSPEPTKEESSAPAAARATPPVVVAPTRPVASGRPRPAHSAGRASAFLGVWFVVVVLLTLVTLPVVTSNETHDTGKSHDSLLLAATQWLQTNPNSGSVLTTSSTARWVEAISDRGAYDPGPTWLLFEPWQVTNAELAYWALNGPDAITNNQVAFGFSPTSTPGQSEAPIYTPYIEGVPIPTVRIDPASIVVAFTHANASGNLSVATLGAPTWAATSTATPTAWLNYTSSVANVSEQVATGLQSGVGWVNFTVTPSSGTNVLQLGFSLEGPPPNDPVVHSGYLDNITEANDQVDWNVSIALGQLPGKVLIGTSTSVSPATATVTVNSGSPRNVASATVTNPEPSEPLRASVEFRTAGTSNPATTLPPVMSTGAFLSNFDIQFALLPNASNFAAVVALLETTYGFHIAFTNSEWQVFSR
ncbi:MAG: hypothetical protein L3K00_00755 [Thermoplasmata archaeon]|nr:hypothetical protein [Thermoplasmata archaeon]